jgi:hypothetical protein
MKALKMTLILLAAFTANLANAKVVRLANISLGYGKLDVSAGGGGMSVLVDASNRLQGVSVKVNANLFGISSKINQYMDMHQLAKGETQRFYMQDGKYPILTIKPKPGFGVNGGQLHLAFLTQSGYQYEDLEIERGANTGQFRLFRGDQMITEIELNVRGYSLDEMKIGWYELSAN